MKLKNSQRGAAPLAVAVLIILLLVIGGLLYWRFGPKAEMQLVCHLKTSYSLENEIYLVRPLASKIQLIQERFEQAKKNFGKEETKSEEILKREDSFIKERLTKIQKDCEGLREKRDALQQQVNEKLKKRNKKVNEIWASAGQDAESVYSKKLSEFKESIAKRARELKLEWPEKFPVEAPDIYVSAFRLGLYRLSQGSVNKTVELAWAEKKLKEWRDFSTKQEAQREEIKGKAFEAQFDVEGQIAELEQQIGKINEELAKEEASLHELEQQPPKESATNSEVVVADALAEEKTKLKQELKKLPEENRVMQEKPQNNVVKFMHLERFAKPGDYEIIARAKQGDSNYWGIVSVTLKPNEIVEVNLEDKHFRHLDAILLDLSN